MDDVDGMKVSSSREVDNNPSVSPEEAEDVESSKGPFTRDSGFVSSTPSQSLKMLLAYNSVNGDCEEKDVNQSEQSVVASSSNNSLYSESPDVTHDSLPEDTSRLGSESSSDNSSKSSVSDASESRLNYSFTKASDNSSPLQLSASDSSSDSDELSGSDLDDSNTLEDDRSNRVETPDTHSSHSFLNDASKSSPMEVDGHEKDDNDHLESDESFKKEDCANVTHFTKKPPTFEISQSSDDNSFDSGQTPGPSLSSGSQEITTPPEVIKPGPPSNESYALKAAMELNSDASRTLNKNSPFHPPSGVFSSVRRNSEQSVEDNSVQFGISEPSAPIIIKEEERDVPLEKSSTDFLSPPTEIIVKIEESENETADVLCSLGKGNSPEEKESTALLTDEIQPAAENSQSSNLDLIELNSNKNEMSIVTPCISSCFPKIENVCMKIAESESEDNELVKIAKNFSINYKGFKKIGSAHNSLKKCSLRWNPFNPARKKDPKTGKYLLQQNNVEDQDNTSLQPEYAHYLGLQPIVKFKCSYCGISNFQSMSALNTHKIECKRTFLNPPPIALDKNKAITIRRRVYMCSVCGSYKPRSEVFQHMLEVHKLYVCLFDKCLKFCQSPEALMHHFQEDHKDKPKYCQTQEDFQREIPTNFYLVCVNCRRVFTEMDDPGNHICPPKPKSKNEVISNAIEPERFCGALSQVPGHTEPPSTSHSWDIAKVTASLKLNKDITMKPITDVQNSDLGQFRNLNICNMQEMHCKNHSESASPEVDIFPAEVKTPSADNLIIKVPSDIEIKPLIPGEQHFQEAILQPTNGSTIEIFPIPPTQKRVVKKKIIRKKRVVISKKKKSENSSRSADMRSSGGSAFPPVSPPIIAPPPIVCSPESPQTEDPMPMDVDCPSEINATSPEEELPREELMNNSLHSSQEGPMIPHRDDSTHNPLPLTERSEISEIKRSLSQDIFKIKLQGNMESDGESDDSQKLSLVVDENTNNSEDFKKDETFKDQEENNLLPSENIKTDSNEIPLASEDIAAMALTLDDKIENVAIQAVVKECVRTSCMSCNYCRHAVKIAVNGKQLALHLLSEHRYTPVKNETNEDVIRKLRSSLDVLQNLYFNTETYDSSDPSIHVPYDKDSNFDCFQCSYVSASHKDLYAHKRKFHTKSLLLCIMCKKNFFSYSELICHICTGTYFADPQVYSVGINFRCCFCRLDTIPSAFRLMVHLRKSHHTCDICLEVCSDQQKLSTHMWKHKLNHLCYRCGIAYASKPDITKHLFWKHGTESVLCKKCLQKKWPHVYHFCIPPTSFICEECNTSFSKAVALKVHKRIHGNDYPYSCTRCEKKFISKKLLSRHIDRHDAVVQKKDTVCKSPDNNKEEIINVTDIDNKDGFQNDNSDSNKESDAKDKAHKKHKKEKDKKDKKVVDVYDLPPLNLSSESDSSDEDSPQKSFPKGPIGNGTNTIDELAKVTELLSDKSKAPDMPKLDGLLDGHEKSVESNAFLNLLKQEDNGDDPSKRKPTASEPVSPFDSSVVNTLLSIGKDEMKNDPMDSMQSDHIDGIWENFYKTNPQNSNLPFPLCAMKSEVAFSIIMGDHDYCQLSKTEPVIKEDLPSSSNLGTHLSGDKLEEIAPLIPEKPQTPPMNKDVDNVPTSKKKLKSPKKKVGKTPDDKNSSSSSDSSSDSDSSCSCATNCSCSSSSDSSSSSSSDSDSSTNEDKKDKRRKKKEKKLPFKIEKESEPTKETHQAEEEIKIAEPIDPPIRESELETDESTSDEEFYDRQPQIIANQLLAEKREKQIGLVGTPVNNGSASPLPVVPAASLQHPISVPSPIPSLPLLPQINPTSLAQESITPSEEIPDQTPKTKPRAKRKRRLVTPKTQKIEKSSEPPFQKYSMEPKLSPFSLFPHTPASVATRPKVTTPIMRRSPSLTEAGGSGSETDNTRLSKRRRVPNKFYGYSSGDEEEKLPPINTPKWRKMDTPLTSHHTPKLSQTIVHPPPTPRIQLTLPKQVIRKPYIKQGSRQKIQSHHPVSDNSDPDSDSDLDDRISRDPLPEPEPVKAEKDVYCYCRCPYDEVSEMIACDDSNCKIEWFHFECVGILVPPKGQWYCPDCRKARGLPA